jgi:hypothetical protein
MNKPMNVFFYIKVFAWIAIVALCASVISDYWLVGAICVLCLLLLTPILLLLK